MKTVVGLFDSTSTAQQVKQTLISDGYDASDVKVVANDANEDNDEYETSSNTESTARGVGAKIGHFFSSLTGGDDDAHSHYAKGVNSGGALLTVTTSDEEASEVASLLKQHGARDIDGGYQDEAESGTPVFGGANKAETLTGGTAIPIVEEELVVGKREVDRGGVRVYSHIVERPVSADVNLHNETVNVERRFVNRPATAADFQTGAGAFELRAMGEEAVVGKTSRVVEEVVVGKQASERTEAIHDTVRKTEVDVEEIPGEVVEKSRY